MFGKLFGKKKETKVKAPEAPQLNIEDLKKVASSVAGALKGSCPLCIS